MIRNAQLVLISLAVMTTACSTLTHSDARQQGRQRWNQVRGRVKCQLAEQQYQAGLFEDAMRTITESLALDPNQVDAYALLARANLELGKPASAQRVLDAAQRVGVTSADLIYLQGVILEQRDDVQAAIEEYAQARALDPNNVDYLVAQAECLVALNRPAAAFELLDEHADRFDDEGTVSTLAAHIAALLGNVEEASKRYERALVTYEGSRLIAEELGRLLVRARRYEQALAVLGPLAAKSNGNGEGDGAVRRALATCYLATGDSASAKHVLSDYAASHPDDTLAQLLLAKAAIATNDALTALRAVDLAQQHEPDRPELWFVRAAVRWKRGNLVAAASDLYDVLQNNPEDVEANCLLAEVLRGQGQLTAARTYFERALELDPACAWAAEGLKSLRNAEWSEPMQPPTKLTSFVAGQGADTNPRALASPPVGRRPAGMPSAPQAAGPGARGVDQPPGSQ
ncbi:MAG: tetratricopeptide repeat protein [Phycisphaerales bacterium]|nr:MAG: tetratricopeptide repeat protein [Phycisphaerales bacterium]